MRARLTFLSGPKRGARRILIDQTISIGGDRSHTVYLPGLPSSDLIALIERRNDSYRITVRDPFQSLTVNSTVVTETVLKDGDLIQIAPGHKIRFGIVPERHEMRKPMRQIVRHGLRGAAHLDAGAVGRCLFFCRDLWHSTAHDASWGVKLGLAASGAAVVLASLLGGLSLIQARAADRRVVALSAQVAAGSTSRHRLEQQVARLRQLEREKAQTEARLGEVTRNLETAEQRLARLERQTPDLLAAIETARHSVAFVLVGYALYEQASGKPLRFASVDADGAPEPDEKGTYKTSVDGSGPIVTSSVTGSGFLIAGGRLVTNRHVAEPWVGDKSVGAAIRRGFEPRYTVARAYFPRLPRAVELQPAAVSTEADVAIMRVATPKGLPALTLAPPERRVTAGDLIVVLGYPTGFDALLAKADEAIARQIEEAAGDDSQALATALASRRLITPLVTLGHVGDVLGSNIVYDAATTHGSSGGPVLNGAGEVVALNYAGLEDFAGARFGIPIRLVHQLLREHPESVTR